MYVIAIHLYLLQIHLIRQWQTAKTKHLFHFRLFWKILVIVKNSDCGQCLFLLQNAHWNNRLAAVGGVFTFTICSHFRRTGIVVPLYSHATKSTPILKNHSTHIFGQNLTIPYPNSHPKNHNKTPQSHTISPLPYLTTLPHSNPNKSNTNKQNIT